MKYVEEGKTAPEAIESALKKHNVSRDDVKVTVIDAGRKGFLGIGAKPAKVEIEVLKQPVEKKVKQLFEEIIKKMGFSAEVTVEKTGQRVLLKVSSEKSSLLIGKRGQTLMALEHIISVSLAKDEERAIRVEIDIDSYKKKRENSLKQIVKDTCEKVKKTGKPMFLPQMDSHGRMLVYRYLKSDPGVSAHSRGNGKIKKILIKPAGEDKAENGKTV